MADLVNKIVDRGAVEQDVKYLIDRFGTLENAIDQINKKSIRIEVDLKGTETLATLIELTRELKTVNDDLTRSVKTLGEANRNNSPILVNTAGGFGKLNNAVATTAKTYHNFNSVGGQFNQLLRELPNLAQSPIIFLQSLTNNVSYFGEAIDEARLKGQSWKDIMKQLAGSVTGLVGILNIAILAITYFTQRVLRDNTSAASMAEKANKKYADSLKSIADNGTEAAAKEISRVRILQGVIESETATREKKLHAAEEMQKLYPNMLDNYTKEEIAAGKAAKAIDELTLSIRQNAVAKIYSDQAAAATVKLAETQDAHLKAIADVDKAQKDLNETTGRLQRGVKGAGTEYTVAAARLKNFKSVAEELRKEEEKASYEVANFQLKAQNAIGKLPDLFTKPSKDKGPKETDLAALRKSIMSDIAKEEADFAKQQLETDKKKQEAIIKSNKSSFEEIRQARWQLHADITGILFLEMQEEKAKNEELHQYNLHQIKTAITDQKTKNELIKQENIRHQKEQERILEVYLQKQLQSLSAYSDTAAKDFEETEERARKNIEGMAKWFKESNLGMSSSAKQHYDQLRETRDAFLSIAQSFQEIGRAIGEGYYDKRMQQLNNEADMLKSNYELEIARIDATAKTEIEAINKKGEAAARYETARLDNERKMKEAQRQRAIFEKSVTIMQIITNTSLAVIKAWTEGDPYTKVIRSAAAGAVGAAQLAAAIAAPVPGYFVGTDNAKPGFGKVGERGRELIVEKDGSLSLSPNHETLRMFAGGEKVITADKTKEILNSINYNPYLLLANQQKQQTDRLLANTLVEAGDITTSKLIAAINKNGYRQSKQNNFSQSPYYKGYKA